MADKTQQFRDMVKLLSDSLTKQEFLDNFKLVIDFLKKADANLSAKIDNRLAVAEKDLSETDQLYQETIRRIQEDNKVSLSNIKKWALESVTNLFAKSGINEKLKQVDDKLAEFDKKEWPDAATVAQEASKLALAELLPKIPTIIDLEAEIPKLGVPVRDALENLENEDRLDISAIDNLQEQLDELKKQISLKNNVVHGGAGSQSGGRIVKSLDLSGQLDGVKTVFSVQSMWRVIAIVCSSFPNVLQKESDWRYDASANTITFLSPVNAATTLAAGQVVTVIFSE